MHQTSSQPPLRASCERCRGQKLRCISSSTNPDEPCQRCIKANVADTCIFVSRARTGRAGRCKKPSISSDSRSETSRKGKGTSKLSLPGMSTFVLPKTASPSLEEDDRDISESTSAEISPSMLAIDQNNDMMDCMPEVSILDPWQQDTSFMDSFCLDQFLQQSSDSRLGCYEAAYMQAMDVNVNQQTDGMAKFSGTSNFSNHDNVYTGLQNNIYTSSTPSKIDSNLDMDMAPEENPGLLTDLSVLLAEMESYKHQLVRLSGDERHDHPIGDAVFFSQRFQVLLSQYHDTSPIDGTLRMSTPTMLLALSCFMTLTRIYSCILKHLQDELSQWMEANSENRTEGRVALTTGSDIQSFRGLRLSQLQPLCFWSRLEVAKTVVSMLLRALGNTERLLSLPLDARVIAVSSSETAGAAQLGQTTMQDQNTAIFEQGSATTPINDRLHETLKEQAKELRDRVNNLLQGCEAARNLCNDQWGLNLGQQSQWPGLMQDDLQFQ